MTPDLTFNERKIAERRTEALDQDDALAMEQAKPLFDAGVTMAGITERTDYGNKNSPPAARDFHDLLLLLQGSMEVEFAGQTHRMVPGELACMPAGVMFRRWAPPTGTWWMFFKVRDIPAWEAFKRNGPYVRAYESAAMLYLLLREVLEAVTLPGQGHATYVQSCAHQMINLLRHETVLMGRKQSRHATAVQKLVNAIEAAPKKRWDRLQMCEALNMSVRQLTQIFRQELGISPRQLVVRIRMRRAMELIVDADLPVKVVAESLGYGSLHSFTRLFTKHIGTSPAACRSRLQH